MSKRFRLIFTFLIIIHFQVSGQTGKIIGTVSDEKTKEELIGASILIKGTKIGTSTDINGNFTLEGVPAEQVELIVSYVSYESKTTSVKVVAGSSVTVNIKLSDNAATLKGVEVVASRKTNTQSAVVMEIRAAKQIVSGVSRQQITRSQDKSAADAMQRIPGVTVVENRFVMIRGVNSRYNSVMINNIMAPSTEVDKRTFSFDIISSSSLDRMLIYKSGSPEYPGDFAGGVIKLFTLNAVEENYATFSLETGYRNGTTGQEYFQSKGAKTEHLGFQNGYRNLPSDFPTTRTMQNAPRNAEIRQTAAHSLENNFTPIERTSLPDMGISFNIGRIFKLGNVKRLTTNSSLNYSNSYVTVKRDFYRYLDANTYDGSTELPKRFQFEDMNYQNDVKINLMSNWSYYKNSRTQFTWCNLFNNISENETIIRNGKDFVQRPLDSLRNYLFGYKNRVIYTSQFEGNHNLDDSAKKHLNWVIGFSYLGEKEPDLRRFRTFKPYSTLNDEVYRLQLPPSSNLFETGRYYGNMSEFTISGGVNYTHNLNKSNVFPRYLKFGSYHDYRYRSFGSRYFSYLYPGFFDPAEGERIRRLPLDQIFAPENIKTVDGLVLEEGTRPIDSYTASNLLNALYTTISYPIGPYEINGGIRAEYNIQKLDAENDFEEIEVNNPVLNVLPFLNLGYNINKKSIVRLSYGKTVNRPEFRELAPFMFYDYKLEAGVFGQSNLVTATIDNLDTRFEFYPRLGETISIGGFYKRFVNPIENRSIITTESPSFSFLNAESAFNYGAELELRKSLKGITNSSFIDKFSVNLNAAYIYSRVDLGAQAVAQDQVRPLQGQSPYIINSVLFYSDNARKFMASLSYNIFGRRIFSVGDDIFPTIYELERHSLDVTISKEFNNRMTIKGGIQNILNYPFRFWQDSDRNTIINDIDHEVFSYRRGSLFNISFSFNLMKPEAKKAIINKTK